MRGQNQFKHHIGTTCAAVASDALWGYATVSMAHLEVETLPSHLAKRRLGYPSRGAESSRNASLLLPYGVPLRASGEACGSSSV